jgi:hypothetical protein
MLTRFAANDGARTRRDRSRRAVFRSLCFLAVLLSSVAATGQGPPVDTAALAPRNAATAAQGDTFTVLLDRMRAELATIPTHKYRAEYDAFISRHAIADPPGSLLSDYVRLRVLNEAVRDGGIFRLRWAVTDQEPSSRRIWAQWIKAPARQDFGIASAVAECDELSGLLGLLARRLDIARVGLFYPTWNHTIAAWQPSLAGKQRTVLVLVPTTQIFLGCGDSFDDTSFKTSRQSIQTYPLRDIGDTDVIPRARADWLISELHAYVKASPDLLSLLRLRRALAIGSSVGVCNDERERLASALAGHLDADDEAALRHFAETELSRTDLSAAALLTALGQRAPG